MPWYAFSVAETARLLVLVGQGKSLREASQSARFDAGRFDTDPDGRRWASRQNALAADYLDHYAPIVIRRYRPTRWPRILILDAQPLELRARDADLLGEDPDRRGGAVLVAAGKDRPDQRALTWLTDVAGDESESSWAEFLATLDGAPEWVVADGAKAIANAVASRWPEAIRYPCEYHLRENARDWLAADGILDLDDLLEQCLWSVRNWDALAQAVSVRPARHTAAWIARNDARVRQMIEARRAFPGFPRGNGPAERGAIAVRARIGERRRNFRNAERLRSTVALMGLDLAEQAEVARYTRTLREAVAFDGAVRRQAWEAGHDRAADAPSLTRFLVSAWRRTAAATKSGMPAAVSSSVMSKAVEANVRRRHAGLAPLVPTIAPGKRVASIKVAGLTLADFPDLLAEWDAVANSDLDPTSLRASREEKVWWVCAEGHRWQAAIVMRTMRGTRCRECYRQWATATTSLAAMRPDLLAEWDVEANGQRSPERTKSNSPIPVVWRCRDFPAEHPTYPLSPRARSKRDVGCPICRRIRPTKGDPAA